MHYGSSHRRAGSVARRSQSLLHYRCESRPSSSAGLSWSIYDYKLYTQQLENPSPCIHRRRFPKLSAHHHIPQFAPLPICQPSTPRKARRRNMSRHRIRTVEVLQGTARGGQERRDRSICERERKETGICANTIRGTTCCGSGSFNGSG